MQVKAMFQSPVANEFQRPWSIVLRNLLLSLPIVCALIFYVNGKMQDLEQSKRERVGIVFLTQVERLQYSFNQLNVAVENDTMDSSDHTLQVIDGQIKVLWGIDATSSMEVKFNPERPEQKSPRQYSAPALDAKWQRAKAALSQRNMLSYRQSHKEISFHLRQMATRAGDDSLLILDPAQESSFLIDSVLLVLPQLNTRVANALSGLIAHSSNRWPLSDEEIQKSAVESQKSVAFELLRDGLTAALRANVSSQYNIPELTQSLTPEVFALETEIDLFIQQSQSVLEPEADALPRSSRLSELTRHAMALIESLHSMNEASLNELDTILEARMRGEQAEMFYALCGLFVLVIANLRVGMRLLRKPQTGRPTAPLLAPCFDELGSLSREVGCLKTELSCTKGQLSRSTSALQEACEAQSNGEIKLSSLLQAFPDIYLRYSASGELLESHAPVYGEVIDADLLGQLKQAAFGLRDQVNHNGSPAAPGGELTSAQDYQSSVSAICLGEKHWFELRFLVHSGNQETTCVARDITSRKESAAQTERQKEMLVAASQFAALGEMTAGMAHEINNPLQNMQLTCDDLQFNLETIQSSIILDCTPSLSVTLAETLESVEIIAKMADRIGSVVKSMKSFSRKAAADPLVKTNIEVVISDALMLCKAKLQAHQVKLNTNIEKGLCIEARASEIGQVLINLVNNSVDSIAILENRWVSIDVSQRRAVLGVAKQEVDAVVFSVTDSGAGIPASLRDKLMQPFFTTKEVGKGTGIGLSVSREIVEAHGGIFYIDETCANTRFCVVIPESRTQPIEEYSQTDGLVA